MESDLLIKEDEFHKENKKLEERTKELMKKVNDVMKIQDNLIRETLNTKTDLDNIRAKKLNSDEVDLSNIAESTRGHDTNDEDLNTADAMGRKGAGHFYRAKIKRLQIENIRIQTENKNKTDEIIKLQKEKQALSEDKEKWFTSYNTAKNTIGKMDSQISSLNSKVQSRDSEITSTKKELEHVKKELKSCNLSLNTSEVRLTRTYEVNEKLKELLRNSKEEEKEMKELHRKQINELTNTVKQIEKQKMELINGIKKQQQLIDILKKQKMYLEAHKIAEITESEYLKILEWKME